MLKAGSKAPEFTLDDMAGGKKSLSEMLKNGPVLVAFYKISCPVCQLAFPYLDRISKGSLQVFGISQNDERGTEKFQKDHKLTMPMLLDRERDDYPASNAYGITHVPSLFLVEPDGKISLAADGFVKRDLESLGARSGVATFGTDDYVPEWKAG